MDIQNLVTGLFDKGEWQVIVVTLGLTFAITYSIKLLYCIFVPSKHKLKTYVRLMAIAAGFIAAALAWPVDTISMKWYGAGALVGPMSIFVYHVLLGVASMPKIKTRFPYLQKIIRGSNK